MLARVILVDDGHAFGLYNVFGLFVDRSCAHFSNIDRKLFWDLNTVLLAQSAGVSLESKNCGLL